MGKRKEKWLLEAKIFSTEAEEHAYWANVTPQERLAETLRLTREKWGAACDRPMEKIAFIRRIGEEE